MGGKSSSVTVGYKFYCGAAFILASCIHKIKAISIGDKDAWEGNAVGETTINIDKPLLFGTKVEGGVQGAFTFMPGGPTQTPNDYLVNTFGPDISAHRNVAMLVLEQPYMGNNPYLKDVTVVGERIHLQDDGSSQWYDATAEIANTAAALEDGWGIAQYGPTQDAHLCLPGDREEWLGYDIGWGTPGEYVVTEIESHEDGYYLEINNDDEIDVLLTPCRASVDKEILNLNPAHFGREILSNPVWGYGYDADDIDDSIFEEAANTLYGESFGLSYYWDDELSAADLLKKIEDHIDGVFFINRDTFKWNLKLNRKDYEVDDDSLLHIQSGVNLVGISNYKKPQFLDLINTVTVKYYDAYNDGNAGLTQSNAALFLQQGKRIPFEINYDMLNSATLAAQVLQRELDMRSNPMASCEVTATSEAKQLRRGSVFKLTDPRFNFNSTIMRVTEISYGDGTNRRIKISCVEDRFALPTNGGVTPEVPNVPPSTNPLPIYNRMVGEQPYLMLVKALGQTAANDLIAADPTLGFYSASAGRNPGNLYAEIHDDDGAGYSFVQRLDFCPFGKLVGGIGPLDDTFTIGSVTDMDELGDSVLLQIDNEIMALTAIADGVLTGVKRGCFDTVPALHLDNAKVFFFEDYSDGSDTQYVDGETIDVKLLSVTPSGTLPIADAPADTVSIVGRPYRPYPPANVQLDAEYFPASVVGPTAALTWAHRDRLSQADVPVDFQSGDIGPEAGTTYSYELYDDDTDTLIDSDSGVTITSATLATLAASNRLVLWSVRDGKDSAQKHVIYFTYTP